MSKPLITASRIHVEKRMAARELCRIGYSLRTVERMTGLPYITVYRIANPGSRH